MALRRKPAGPKPDWLIIGLGNPGAEFRDTRHNIGADVVALLASELKATKQKSRHGCELWQASLPAPASEGETNLLLAQPTTYMNHSGEAVRGLVRHWRFYDWERLVIVHDELDLPPGRMRIKAGGGLGGHNGLVSIRSRLGASDFTRIRVGVGKPPSKELGADYVLSAPPPEERELLQHAKQTAVDTMLEMVTMGLEAAISRQS